MENPIQENLNIEPIIKQERGINVIQVGTGGVGCTHALHLAEHIAMMKETNQPIIIVDDLNEWVKSDFGKRGTPDFMNRKNLSDLKVRIGNSGLEAYQEALSMHETFQIKNYHCMNNLKEEFYPKNDGTIVNESKMRASCLKAKKARLKRKKNKRK